MGKLAVKNDEPTSPEYGKAPEERSIEELFFTGVAPIDKPCGPSSHEVPSWVKKILQVKKSGHSGTLDPNVSGVLPVGINSATKAMGYLLRSKKEYVGIMQLHRDIARSDIESAFRAFTGEIKQLPPLRSAVRRRERKRKVYYLDALEYKGREVLFVVGCEAGTYIRKLCFDIGRYLGVGANMLELRRTKAGVLTEDDTVSLLDLTDAMWLWKEKGEEGALRKCVIPLEMAVDLPRVVVRDSAVDAICHGASLASPGIAKIEPGIEEGDEVALMSQKGELVSIGRANMAFMEMLESEKGIAAGIVRVIMEKGTYPKMWKTSK